MTGYSSAPRRILKVQWRGLALMAVSYVLWERIRQMDGMAWTVEYRTRAICKMGAGGDRQGREVKLKT